MEIEKSDDEAPVAALRRIIHTLKGESALLGLADVERLCHATDDGLSEREPVKLVDALLDVKDWWSRAFDFYSGKASAPVVQKRNRKTVHMSELNTAANESA